MIERILVAHDGSNSARKAFHFAVELTARLGARLRMICVDEVVESGNNELAPQLRADLERLEKMRKSQASEAGS
jgi:nucleotide-binding universal stress UspA family protein